MTGRLVLAVLISWGPIASAVCEAECVFGLDRTPAHHETRPASGNAYADCHRQHSGDAPAPSDSQGRAPLSCCCIVGAVPVVVTDSVVTWSDPLNLAVAVPQLHSSLAGVRAALQSKAPPGLGSPHRNLPLLI